MQNIALISIEEVIVFTLVICRMTGLFFLVPPFSDNSIKPIIRFVLSISITLLMYNQFAELIIPAVQSVKHDQTALVMMVIVEIGVGIAMGTIVKTLILAIQVAGLTIASQTGISAAVMMDPSQNHQNSILGLFLSMLTMIIFLESGMHIRIIAGFCESYRKIPAGAFFNHYDNFISVFLSCVRKMWSASMQISMPFILINISMMMGAGILAKLMPQLQIFFIMLPVQILVGVIVFIAVLSGILFWFLKFFTNEINMIF